MTNSTLQVANEIARQLGGTGRLQSFVGAYHMIGDDNSFRFKFKGSRKLNYCKVTLNETDTYTVEFGKVNMRTFEYKKASEDSGFYCDQLVELFEKTTGLFLHF